ncbi:MAG: polysaccharide biosynthesis protein [Acidobacteria bacterium]|nr:polysaccharide biosynthesis protein [Acidobacteriota bacterium]
MRNSIEKLVEQLAPARVLILIAFHALVFWGSYVFAALVRFEFEMPPDQLASLETSLPLVVGVQLVVGFLFGFYRGWWRYVGITDVVRLVAGLSTAQAVIFALWFVGPGLGWTARLEGTSRGVLLIDWAFALLILFGARISVRLFRDRTRLGVLPADVRNVLIVGAGDAGEALLREIQHRPQLGMKVVGFLDDQRAKWGSLIRGVPVIGPIEKAAECADDLDVVEALLAIPSASGKRLREIVRTLDDADLEFKTIPGVDQLVSGRVHVSQLRPVNIEDLIRRDRIELPGDPVRRLFAGKNVLVTGAGGSIGSELANQILDYSPSHVALLERSEFALYEVDKRIRNEKPWLIPITSRHLCDINDEESVRPILERIKPDIVLHAAAHKHVPLGEENPAEYVRNNTIATRRLAELACGYQVERFVFISTDKAINPSSVMGATKRAGEIALLDYAERSAMSVTIVRFGNVLGSSGSVVPLFMEQIAAGGPVTITHPEVTRYFLRKSEAISLVLQAAALGGDRSMMMLDMGEPIVIADLARDLIRLTAHDDDAIEIKFTGLRPGEKLFEEIRLDSETSIPTEHPQIVLTRAPQPDREQVAEILKRLEISLVSNLEEPVSILRDLIPEFSPPASVASPNPQSSASLVPAPVSSH